MKGNKIDDLFRKGLSSNKISAPSTAWEKIETQLPTKSKKGIYFWISIAASILLVFAFGWIMLANSGSEMLPTDGLSQNVKPETEKLEPAQKSPEPVQSPIIAPEVKEPQQLVAENTQESKPEKEDEVISAPSREAVNHVVSSNEQPAEDIQDIVVREPLNIEMISISQRFAPKFYITERMAQRNLMIDLSIDLDSFINSNTVVADIPEKKKRFSLLSGLVTVAKGVNSGKIGLSEMRKSKNDFFNNDLKYGSDEGEEEDLDEDLDKEEDDINKK
ncbi:hypothetical protein [Roseivirga sp. E12]|uniref:hypothetical protein n=1 Tax=Roseivirga sp. E12 TaxID=2819237 RepID=UPI001ABD0749|nr:hypothetical protein [Roseivirga sp. E12]MBO3700211.1 hypothetical protein [Roseivirga sp. E12]